MLPPHGPWPEQSEARLVFGEDSPFHWQQLARVYTPAEMNQFFQATILGRKFLCKMHPTWAEAAGKEQQKAQAQLTMALAKAEAAAMGKADDDDIEESESKKRGRF